MSMNCVTRHSLSNNIQFVSVYDHLDKGTKEYEIGIRTMDQGMNTERVQEWYQNQVPRDEYGKIKRMRKQEKDRKIQEVWEDTRGMGKYDKDRNMREGQEGTITGGSKIQRLGF